MYRDDPSLFSTWGVEHSTSPTAMLRVEYQALRKITGAYHGSSHTSLGLGRIAAVDSHVQAGLPLHILSAAARAIHTGDL